MAKPARRKSTSKTSPSSKTDMAAPKRPLSDHVCGIDEASGETLKPVLVMQGGGALGAYQAGVYEAMHEAGCEPEWVIGTSIGAITAGIIAGNRRERRLEALKEFWNRLSRENRTLFAPFNFFPAATTMMFGLPGFFSPQPLAALGLASHTGPENAALYSTTPLGHTLAELIDPALLNAKAPRLTVGAVDIATSTMRYFDSRDEPLSLSHIMASGALPPAFPAIEVAGKYYWDGGIMSNTPIEAVFDDMNRQSSLIFSVEVWHGDGPLPTTLNEALARQKDIQFASRDDDHIRRQQQLHRLRHVITELVRRLPDEAGEDPEALELAGYGCMTRMHIVRLEAPMIEGEDSTKDIDFSPYGVETRWQAGREATLRMLDKKPWVNGPFDPLDAVIIHKDDAPAVQMTK